MSKHTHTPGPWSFAWHNNHDAQITFACVVVGDEVKVIGHGAEQIANARLIASAPELLEALQAVRRACPMLGDGLGEQVDAAIARATGSEA